MESYVLVVEGSGRESFSGDGGEEGGREEKRRRVSFVLLEEGGEKCVLEGEGGGRETLFPWGRVRGEKGVGGGQ